MPNKLHHALTRADYTLQDDGTIRVVDGDKWGRFDGEGYWLEGELRSCDPQMCRWLASGPLMAQHAARAAARQQS